MPDASPVRAPRIPPPGSPATVFETKLAKSRTHLDRLRVHHLDLVSHFLSAADGQIWATDLVIGAAMSRSYSLVDGFISTFDAWNPIVAAPILRMQIDNLVRMAYIATAPRGAEVAAEVLAGTEFRKMKDAEGQKLTDARLLHLASPTHPWLQDVYNATSGWVHFSPTHVAATWQVSGLPPSGDEQSSHGRFFGAFPLQPEQIPPSALQELLLAMIQATEELFSYVESWATHKGLPPGQTRGVSL